MKGHALLTLLSDHFLPLLLPLPLRPLPTGDLDLGCTNGKSSSLSPAAGGIGGGCRTNALVACNCVVHTSRPVRSRGCAATCASPAAATAARSSPTRARKARSSSEKASPTSYSSVAGAAGAASTAGPPFVGPVSPTAPLAPAAGCHEAGTGGAGAAPPAGTLSPRLSDHSSRMVRSNALSPPQISANVAPNFSSLVFAIATTMGAKLLTNLNRWEAHLMKTRGIDWPVPQKLWTSNRPSVRYDTQ